VTSARLRILPEVIDVGAVGFRLLNPTYTSTLYSRRNTYQNQINPVSGAGADISVGKKILALIATNANKKTSRIKNGPTFWRKKVMVS
jgi:hypothetical protein